jgi:hypothetical protein
MNEAIEVQFRQNGKRQRVKRQLPGGIEFDERDPLERTIGLEFSAQSEITRMRLDSIRRIQGWAPGEFKLKMSVEDGSIVLRGVTEHALPEGRYRIRTQIEEVSSPRSQTAVLDHDGKATVSIDVKMDNRSVAVDLTDADEGILRVLDRSRVDGAKAIDWLQDTDRRPTRQACLLNLLASLRSRPTLGAPLLALVDRVFLVANDRIYAKLDRAVLSTLQQLADHPTKPFFAEGRPHARIHERLLDEIPEPPEVRMRFKDLTSFRAEGKPSMQVVVAVPPPDLAYTYAEFDLDLGNPLQDLVGVFVHLGELLDGKPTNHLDMRKVLAKSSAKDFMYYTLV